MPIFRVQSGDLDINVRAITAKTAAFLAVNRYPNNLGTLISVTDKEGIETTFSAYRILEDMDLEIPEDQN